MRGNGRRHGMAISRRRNGVTAAILFGLVGGMVGLAFASVPLYRLFCQVTGYGGTPTTEAKASPGVLADRTVRVTFDANTDPALPWRFRPERREITVRLGEEVLAYYSAKNLSGRTLKGTATFSVTPYKAASYFNKIDCFCFTEQVLAPGEEASLPVLFYVDPEMIEDADTRDVMAITLSYTFFPVDEPEDGGEPETAAPARVAAGDGPSGG